MLRLDDAHLLTALTIAVHWLHVLAGIVWFGSQVFLYAALWPALLRRPEGEARAFLGAFMPAAGRLMQPAFLVVVVTGLVRGTVLGPVRSLGALGTPYGLTFVASLLLVAALTVRAGRLRTRLGGRVFGDGAFPHAARTFLRRQGAVTLGALAAVLVGMVLMRFGL